MGLGISPRSGTSFLSRSIFGLGMRDRGEKRLRVGVLGIVKKFLFIGNLDEPSQVHHADPVTDVFHHRKVVGYEE